MDRTDILDALNRLEVNASIEYAPPKHERTEIARNACEARRKLSALSGPCAIRITRTRIDHYVIHLSMPL